MNFKQLLTTALVAATIVALPVLGGSLDINPASGPGANVPFNDVTLSGDLNIADQICFTAAGPCTTAGGVTMRYTSSQLAFSFGGQDRLTLGHSNGFVSLSTGLFVVSGPTTVTGTITHNGFRVGVPSTQTVPDDGAGTTPTFILLPTTSTTWLTCNDANGCSSSAFDESGWTDGTQFCVVNAGANTITLNDSAGVAEMAGNFAMGQWDAACFVYKNDRWVETNRSNN